MPLAALMAAAGCSDDDDSNGSGGGMGGAGQCLAFGSLCTAADTCCDAAGATGECFAFGMGARCTIPCPADPADCPNMGEGCNNMTPAYCKAPP